MALSESVEQSLKEAEASLRNALAYAARQERPVVCTTISKVIQEIETLQSFDSLMDKLEDRMKGDSGGFWYHFLDRKETLLNPKENIKKPYNSLK
jgi:hypothetical protein